MVEKSFKNKTKLRKQILQANKDNDFMCKVQDSNILISVPHAVSQIRLGKYKVAEIGTLAFGHILAEELNANLIVKTQNNNDDANFDESCAYRDKINQLISAVGTKYILDIHGMKKSRDFDVNLGINLGNNIKTDVELYDKLVKELEKEGFKVGIDDPFKASKRTIAGCFAEKYNVWAVQVEINCGITNESKNNEKANKLLDCFVKVFKSINNKVGQ